MAAEVGVWDEAPSAEVTATLCASAVALWGGRLPDEALTEARTRHALLSERAAAAGDDTAIDQLRDVHGSVAGGGTDIVGVATTTAAALARAVQQARDGHVADGHHLVTFAALDAVARADGLDVSDVVRASAISAVAAARLTRVFATCGTLPAGRADVTVATVAAGLAVGLVCQGDDETRLAHTLGVLASCSAATGPAPTSGDGWTLVLAKAAGNAVLAHLLVARGFSSNPRALEAGRGLLRALTGAVPAPELEALVDLTRRPPAGVASDAGVDR